MTLTELNEKIQEGYHILYFTAVWCGPCRVLGPMIDMLADDYSIIKVDTDKNTEIAIAYGIRSVPNLLFVVDGMVREQAIGIKSVQELNRLFAKHKP